METNTIAEVAIIASVISNLLGPVLPGLIRSRNTNPTPTPDVNQPKNLIQRMGGIFKRMGLSPFVFPPIFIAVNIWTLLYIYHHTQRITLKVVMLIAIIVGNTVFALLQMFFAILIQETRQLRRDAIEDRRFFGEHMQFHEEEIRLLGKVSSMISDPTLKSPPIKPPPNKSN